MRIKLYRDSRRRDPRLSLIALNSFLTPGLDEEEETKHAEIPKGAKVVFGKVIKDGHQIGTLKDGKFVEFHSKDEGKLDTAKASKLTDTVTKHLPDAEDGKHYGRMLKEGLDEEEPQGFKVRKALANIEHRIQGIKDDDKFNLAYNDLNNLMFTLGFKNIKEVMAFTHQ